MKAFLQELTEEIYNSCADLSKVTVVFPNRRAALYFRKYLGELITKPVFSPRLITFEDFVSGLSPLRVPDKLELVFRLHQSYTETMGVEAEPFDQFFMWGEMLLRDFDEADRYMIDAKMLLADLSNLKELDAGLDYLSEEQITFLKNFLMFGKNFILFIKILMKNFLRTDLLTKADNIALLRKNY
jgi:hypothetical protein